MAMSSDGEQRKKTWGTWEELVLACAVKRHGFKNWDSVSVELQTKTSLPHLLTTPQCCKQKYHDLERRFNDDPQPHNNNNHNVLVPWLEHLRKVRVDELKRELQRCDLSILSLQLQVKKLEEEREKPDLEIEKTRSLNDNDKTDDPQKSERRPVKEVFNNRFLVSPAEEESNRSVNESNSTGFNPKHLLPKSEPEPAGGQSPVLSRSKGELGDSVTPLSSDVQSSASFGIGTERKRGSAAAGGHIIEGTYAESEPLIRLLDLIRTHNHHLSSLFERRLKSQESNEYKELVRQHVDLETIQTRVERGSYSACILTFYRDLLLLFNNAIVYFPKASLESEAAHQLRNLVSNEIKKETHKSDSSQEEAPPLPTPPPQTKPLLERSDSLLAKQKASAPIIVCRKRSSVSAKPSSSFAQKGDNQKQPSDGAKKPATDVKQPSPVEQSLLKVKTEEKPITTGARSSRRSSRNLTSKTPPAPSTGNKKQKTAAQGSKGGSGSVNKRETPKTDNKKKAETSDKKKSVVDFLKRIKKNSPVHTVKRSKGGEEQKKTNNSSGKKERILLRSSDKKQAKEESSSPSKKSVGRPPRKMPEASGKRGRDTGGKEAVLAKRQSKRTKR
ncbi:hypothetical protein WN943_020973 [Citrus x changshan-huyou]